MRIRLQYEIQHHHNRWTIIVLVACLTVTNCDLLLKPENIYAKVGDPNSVILTCESTFGYRLSWLTKASWSSERSMIYNGYRLHKSVTSYCRVINGIPGQYSMSLTPTVNAAQQYVCLEPRTMMEASAELIIIESDPECSNISTDGENTTLTCHIRFHGNWAPVMEWTMGISSEVIIEGVNNTLDGNSLTSRLVVPVNQSHVHKLFYACTTKFRLQEKSLDTTADNVPKYSYTWEYITVTKERGSKPGVAAIVAAVVAAIAFLGVAVYVMRKISAKNMLEPMVRNILNWIR